MHLSINVYGNLDGLKIIYLIFIFVDQTEIKNETSNFNNALLKNV